VATILEGIGSMSEVGKSVPLTGEALKRLEADRSAEVRERADRLGGLVRRMLKTANTDPRMQFSSGDADDMQYATGEEYLVDGRHGAFLEFGVPSHHGAWQNTDHWLTHAEKARLMLNTYDKDITDDDIHRGDADPVSYTMYYIAPAPEYGARQKLLPEQPHVATYEDGSRLDHQDTETVIGVLTMLAEQTSASTEQNGSAPT